ncbi:MAG: hypothetical protein AB7V32_03760, partial [Candidatus Berkiella sp.]
FVQSVWGINEKVEGFFDICHARGLNGEQGVIIPNSNVKNLMLRKDIVVASEQSQFSVYAVNTIDEALVLLTGLSPEEIKKRCNATLKKYAESRKGLLD